jgi:PPP family 3-phenylpropionic acid transporter
MFALRMAAFYGAIFLIYGVQIPYLAVWLNWRGLPPSEIGVVVALPLFARLLVTPSVAVRADMHGQHRGTVIVLAWLALAGALLLIAIPSRALIPVAVLVMMVATYTAVPLAEAVAMTGVRALGLDYGRMRLWGSLTFIAANVAGGFAISAFGPEVIGYALVAAALSTVIAAHVLPDGPGQSTLRGRPSLQVAWQVVRERDYLLLVAAAGGIQASHAVFYTFGVLHWQASGHSAAVTGLLWSIGVLVEVALFAFSKRAVEVAGPRGLLLIGSAAGLVRWSVMALDPPISLLVPLQALHALTFAATYIGTVHLAQTLAPDGTQGTSQALLSAITAGIATGIAMATAGVLYDRYGAGSYFAMTLLAGLGGLAALKIGRGRERPSS